MRLRRCKHNWLQVSIQIKPTTFPGNAAGTVRVKLSVATLSGDYCPNCGAIRTPTELDDVRWPVA